MTLGTKVHYALEILDFKNPDYDNLNVDDYIKEKIKKMLSEDVFLNLKDANIYKEYEFMYEEDNVFVKKLVSLIPKNFINVYHEYEFSYQEDDKKYHGVIDLIIEYESELYIIDYKLKNIDDENYITQLNGYKKYIENKFNKETNIYLYSIIEEKIKKVN